MKPPADSAFVTELKARGLYEVAYRICRPLGVLVDELCAPGRAVLLVEARRQLAGYLKQRKWSSKMIGRLLARDHTTILELLKDKSQRRRRRRRGAGATVVSIHSKKRR